MKKTYIIPDMMVVSFIPTQPMLQTSVTDVSGTAGIGRGNDNEQPGVGDVKGITDVNLWDNEW